MAKRTRLAPFGQWMEANGFGPKRHAELAKILKCSEASIRNYRLGLVPPKLPMLGKLTTLTGLPVEAFLFPREWKAAA